MKRAVAGAAPSTAVSPATAETGAAAAASGGGADVDDADIGDADFDNSNSGFSTLEVPADLDRYFFVKSPDTFKQVLFNKLRVGSDTEERTETNVHEDGEAR
jgi:hypothetical protein